MNTLKIYKILIALIFLPRLCLAGVILPDGGWVYQQQLKLGAGAKAPSDFALNYYSRSTQKSEVGFGWCGPWFGKIDKININQIRVLLCGRAIWLQLKMSPSGNEQIWQGAKGEQLFIEPTGADLFTGEQIHYRFNASGWLTQIFRPNGKEELTYDGLDRVRSWKTPNSEYFFVYNNLNPLAAAIRTNTGSSLRLTYNGFDLVQITNGNESTRFKYDEFSNMISIQKPNAESQNIEYDSQKDQVLKFERNLCSDRFTYQNNPNGKITQIKRVSACQGLETLNYQYTFNSDSNKNIPQISIAKTKPLNLSNQNKRNFASIPKPKKVETTNLNLGVND